MMAKANAVVIDLAEFRRRRDVVRDTSVTPSARPSIPMMVWYPVPVWFVMPCWQVM